MLDAATVAVATEQERPRLLFVDDERRILVSLKSIFRNDYEVRITTSGGEALDILKDWAPDVIISDQRMPQMTGVEVLKAAAEIRPQTTRVLLTGYSDLEAIIGSVNESEVFRFVSKPWRRSDLSKTMEAAVRRARQVEDQGSDGAGVDPLASEDESTNNNFGVLVLDSNDSERKALQHTLNISWPTHGAGTIADALSLIEQQSIGVVMTESIVEGEAVTTLVNGLREVRPDLVYIIMTHQPDAQHIIDLINYGQVYRVLRKPLKSSVLRGAVTLAGRRHTQLRSDPEQAGRINAEVETLPSERQSQGVLAKIRNFLRF